MMKNGIQFCFDNEDNRCEGLDPQSISDILICTQTAGLIHKEMLIVNDGEQVTITAKFADEGCLRAWFEQVPHPYYKIAMRI